MPIIACILPDPYLMDQTRLAFHGEHDDIRLEVGLMKKGILQAEKLAGEGFEVFISRGMTAYLIKNANPEWSVVEIPFTVMDVFQTIGRANLYGKSIGVVAFAPLISGLDYFGTVMDTSIRFYPLKSENEVEAKVLEAVEDNVDIIVGGAITGNVVNKRNIPFAVIESSPESLRQAAQEAKNIALAKQREKTKGNLFRVVVDYAYDGIISVDTKGLITIFNPVAEKITQIPSQKAIGRNIREVLPDFELHEVLSTSREDLAQLLSINNDQVVCNKVPINVNDKVVGAVINFQDVTKLQRMEAKVRRRLFSTGHVAHKCFDDIIGTSHQIQKSISLARDFARTDSAILILGETGTGKEVFAQSIHNGSRRSHGPFVALNCAALPEQILESELFGYVGGAFTGASQKGKAGLFEVAHGGTLFLDEIGEMSSMTQGKLLRVLQEKQVMRLGSDRVTPIDVRIISATNRPLKQLVNQKEFRADLYYRLDVLQLRLYPLRDRNEDVIALAGFFLGKHAAKMNRKLRFTPNALKELTRHNWPGNIRELQNVVERVLATLKGSKIDTKIVRLHLEDQFESEINMQLRDAEVEDIRRALVLGRGKHAEAAKILGISRSTLWRRLKKIKI
ncbi:sigma-54-dependent Fis family transcriptional regulator [Desulfopila inferna]|uniref:sigma-54-dependent Fis family transcriptional regulator n=1 Tax=Desulfopila inferna TaxID=468528 RepID=UPI0019668376|nr:sigma-54-dependent Fis family transcriptional regulator [Desulfopila inferna]MBM9603899.1 sigma 54-interacting transcriptional regulator [Desulfopila inferna]